MRVDWNERVGGIEMICIRNLLRDVGEKSISKRFVEERLAVPENTSSVVLKQLLARHLLAQEVWSGEEPYYAITGKGRQLACTRRMKRINRAKALPILQKFRERIESVNEQRDLIYYVKEVRLFGSFIDPLASDYGNLDVAVDFQVRSNFREKLKAHCEARAERHGKSWQGWDAVDYCKREVKTLITARDRYIFVTCMLTLKEIETRSEPFYDALP